MKKTLLVLAIATLTALGVSSAHAGGLHISIGLPLPPLPPLPGIRIGVPTPVYAAPPVVYAQPAPVVTAPAPVVVAPPAVVYAPPVYVAPAPVYFAPRPWVRYGWGYRHYYHRW